MCFTDLNQNGKMIIFESILTTFGASSIFFEAAGAKAKIGLSLKLKHHCQILIAHINETTVFA